MINLDQVRTLEWKVKQAVQLIVHLRRENDTLRGRLSDTEVRVQELESLLESFKATQSEMESGIRSALEDLDHLEVGEVPESSEAQVEALSYPPAVEAGFEAEDPAGIFDKSSAPESAEAPHEPSFEEEYAALAAEEAAAEADASEGFDAAPVVEEERFEPVPDSVELEEGPTSTEEESLFLEPEPAAEPVVPEEKQPEQPGLGIF